MDANPRKSRGQFPITRWSLILATREQPTVGAREALASLCAAYWNPLYAYARRQGHSVENAQDLTQGFFALLIEKHYVADFDQERGRFRSFLLGAFKHFLANEHEWRIAHKRGGGTAAFSLDTGDAEQRYSLEPSHDLTPDQIYEKRWVLVLLDRALDRLRRSSARDTRFDRLRMFLTGDAAAVSYLQLAGELGMSEGAVKVAVHRLRHRFRDALEAEIAETVADPELVKEEMQHLLLVVSM